MQEMQETQVRSLGQEDPLDKTMATHTSIHAWRNLWTEEPGGYSPLGHKESDTTEQHSRAHKYRVLLALSLNCDLSVVTAPGVQLRCLYLAGRNLNLDFCVSSGKYLAYSAQIL